MTDFCIINLVEGQADETPRETIFSYDPFQEASYRENLNEIKYLLSLVQDFEQAFRESKFYRLDRALCNYISIL